MFSSVGRQAFRRGRKTPREHYAGVLANTALIAVVTFTSTGSVLVPKAAISLPSRPIRYLWKFHLGMFVMPSSAAAHLWSGMALGPITSLFSASGNLMPNLVWQKVEISLLDLYSCPRKLPEEIGRAH